MQGWTTNAALDLQLWETPIRKVRRPRVSRRFKQRIYWRDKGICAYCSAHLSFDEATLDHVNPLVRGGSNRKKENFVISCRACNNAKGPASASDEPDLTPWALLGKWDELVNSKPPIGRFKYFINSISPIGIAPIPGTDTIPGTK